MLGYPLTSDRDAGSSKALTRRVAVTQGFIRHGSTEAFEVVPHSPDQASMNAKGVRWRHINTHCPTTTLPTVPTRRKGCSPINPSNSSRCWMSIVANAAASAPEVVGVGCGIGCCGSWLSIRGAARPVERGSTSGAVDECGANRFGTGIP